MILPRVLWLPGPPVAKEGTILSGASALVPLRASREVLEVRACYTHYTENKLSGTLTYLKDSTMAETIPVTIITIPRTQKRPVHEVKST